MERGRVTAHVTTIDMTAWCFLRSWFDTLRAQGHEVHLYATLGEFAPRLAARGVVVHDVAIPRRIAPRGDLRALWRLYRAFRSLRPDIVHTHTSKAGFIGRLAAWLARVPVIIHTMHEPPHNAAGGRLTRLLYIGLERLAAHFADHVVTVSRANEREILRQRLVAPQKLSVIREGLDLALYPPAADPRAAVRALGIPDHAPVVGTVGRLEPAKGHTWLIRAVPRILAETPEARFVIVGGGYLRPALQAEIDALGVAERVFLTGYREDMLELMQGFDVFALPSLWEGLGIVLLEAMAYARPLVASAVGGVNDVIVDGETGLLVAPRDSDALACAISTLLRDPDRRAALGAAGRRRLEREFRDEVCNAELGALYDRLLSK
jgi:glycosyltransferase involved in cell wall biosynthesis